MLIKYTTLGGGIFDFSAIVVFLGFIFFGVVLCAANCWLFLRLKNKQILNHILVYQISHLAAYTLLCILSAIFIDAYYSYHLAFLMPIIIMVFIVVLNTILRIVTKQNNQESNSSKISMIALILLLCVSAVSTYHYYTEWDSCEKWAQVREIPSDDANWSRDFEAVVFEINGGNVEREYRIIRSKRTDAVEHISMIERFCFDNGKQGKEILKQLKKVYTNMKYYVFDLYEYNTYLDYRYFHTIMSEVSWEHGNVGYYYALTEDFLNKTNPIIKDVSVDGKVSYSKLKQLLLDNGYEMTVE